MRKLSFKIVKLINWFFNESLTVEEKANSIYGLLKDKNPLVTIAIFEALEKRVESEMRIEEEKSVSICRAVNTKWKYPTYEAKKYNTDFDKAYETVVNNFEIITAKK